MNVIWKGSPNFSSASNRKPIDRIVLHWWGNPGSTPQSVHNEFNNPATQSSAHYSISNTSIWQYVKEEDVAWHASNWGMNQRSIGVEHDANTEKQASPETLNTSIALVADLCKRYNLPADSTHIIKHSSASATQCPGSLPVDLIIKSVNEALNPVKPEETDEYRALKVLTVFKESEETLRQGNLQGAIRAAVGAYTDLQKVNKNIAELIKINEDATGQIRSLTTIVDTYSKNRAEISEVLGVKDEHGFILAEVKQLIALKDAKDPGLSMEQIVSFLISFLKKLKRKEVSNK